MDELQEQIQEASLPRRSWRRRVVKILGFFFLVVLILFAVALVVGFFVFRKNARQRVVGNRPLSSSMSSEFTMSSLTPAATRTLVEPRRSIIETNDDPSLGVSDAKVVIVEFGDFGCPFSRKAFPVVRELMSRYGDRVRFIYRSYPLRDVHPQAEKAAQAGKCAQSQGKFWPLHDKMFQNQERLGVDDLKRYAREVGMDGKKFDTCLDSGTYAAKVEENYQAGIALGVEGTPTWFVNGEKLQGAFPKDLFEEMIESALAKTK